MRVTLVDEAFRQIMANDIDGNLHRSLTPEEDAAVYALCVLSDELAIAYWPPRTCDCRTCLRAEE